MVSEGSKRKVKLVGIAFWFENWMKGWKDIPKLVENLRKPEQPTQMSAA